MKLLRYPAINAVFISIFSAFYSLLLYFTSDHEEFNNILYYEKYKDTQPKTDIWSDWGAFLSAGHQKYIAIFIIILTFSIVTLLVKRHRTYNEYQVQFFISYFFKVGIASIIALAIFYFAILSESAGIVEKITLFVIVHWISILLSDLYIVLRFYSK